MSISEFCDPGVSGCSSVSLAENRQIEAPVARLISASTPPPPDFGAAFSSSLRLLRSALIPRPDADRSERPVSSLCGLSAGNRSALLITT